MPKKPEIVSKKSNRWYCSERNPACAAASVGKQMKVKVVYRTLSARNLTSVSQIVFPRSRNSCALATLYGEINQGKRSDNSDFLKAEWSGEMWNKVGLGFYSRV